MSVYEFVNSAAGCGSAPHFVPACLPSNDCSLSLRFELFTLRGIDWPSHSLCVVHVEAAYA